MRIAQLVIPFILSASFASANSILSEAMEYEWLRESQSSNCDYKMRLVPSDHVDGLTRKGEQLPESLTAFKVDFITNQNRCRRCRQEKSDQTFYIENREVSEIDNATFSRGNWSDHRQCNSHEPHYAIKTFKDHATAFTSSNGVLSVSKTTSTTVQHSTCSGSLTNSDLQVLKDQPSAFENHQLDSKEFKIEVDLDEQKVIFTITDENHMNINNEAPSVSRCVYRRETLEEKADRLDKIADNAEKNAKNAESRANRAAQDAVRQQAEVDRLRAEIEKLKEDQ